MSQVLQLDRATIVASLNSCVCPVCAGPKERHRSMCRRDYFRLPKDIRDALYRRLRHGYEEALTEACSHLNVDVFHVEKGAQPL